MFYYIQNVDRTTHIQYALTVSIVIPLIWFGFIHFCSVLVGEKTQHTHTHRECESPKCARKSDDLFCGVISYDSMFCGIFWTAKKCSEK